MAPTPGSVNPKLWAGSFNTEEPEMEFEPKTEEVQLILPYPMDTEVFAELDRLQRENDDIRAKYDDLLLKHRVQTKRIRRLASVVDELWENLIKDADEPDAGDDASGSDGGIPW
jgi:hypothetical protein